MAEPAQTVGQPADAEAEYSAWTDRTAKIRSDGELLDLAIRRSIADLRLLQKPLAERLVLGECGRQELERDPPLQARVLREEDHAHPAPAEQRLDPVAEELAADPKVRRNGHASRVSPTRAPAGKTEFAPRFRLAPR